MDIHELTNPGKLDHDLRVLLTSPETPPEYLLNVVVRVKPRDVDECLEVIARLGDTGHVVRRIGAIGARLRAGAVAHLLNDGRVVEIESDQLMTVAGH